MNSPLLLDVIWHHFWRNATNVEWFSWGLSHLTDQTHRSVFRCVLVHWVPRSGLVQSSRWIYMGSKRWEEQLACPHCGESWTVNHTGPTARTTTSAPQDSAGTDEELKHSVMQQLQHMQFKYICWKMLHANLNASMISWLNLLRSADLNRLQPSNRHELRKMWLTLGQSWKHFVALVSQKSFNNSSKSLRRASQSIPLFKKKKRLFRCAVFCWPYFLPSAFFPLVLSWCSQVWTLLHQPVRPLRGRQLLTPAWGKHSYTKTFTSNLLCVFEATGVSNLETIGWVFVSRAWRDPTKDQTQL